jgi:hypothetical protein
MRGRAEANRITNGPGDKIKAAAIARIAVRQCLTRFLFQAVHYDAVARINIFLRCKLINRSYHPAIIMMPSFAPRAARFACIAVLACSSGVQGAPVGAQIEIVDGADGGTDSGIVTTSGTVTTYTPASNSGTATLTNTTLQTALATGDVVVDGVNKVTVDAAVTWSAATSLTVETTTAHGAIVINQAITGTTGTTGSGEQASLIIDCANNGFVTTGFNADSGLDGSIDVDNFTLENGFWQQVVSANSPTAANPGYLTALPDFTVTNDFQLLNTTTFSRFAGGTGTAASPFQITDIYSIQGIGSPSDHLLSYNYIQNNDIDIDPDTGVVTINTLNWNGGDGTTAGAGFVPIGEGGKSVEPFTGVYDGNGFAIYGFGYYRPEDNLTGLFGEVSGTVENVTLDAQTAFGLGISGVLVGRLNTGYVENCDVEFDLAGADNEPAQETPGEGTTANQSKLKTNLGVGSSSGSVVGEVMGQGHVVGCETNAGYEIEEGFGGGIEGVGGLVGVNYGTIVSSSATGGAGSLVSIELANNESIVSQSVAVGGLVGANFGVIDGGTSSGTVPRLDETGDVLGAGNYAVGGFVGANYGTIDSRASVAVNGKRTPVSYQSFSTANVDITVGGIEEGSGSYYAGGFAGLNYGTIDNAYSAPTITGPLDADGAALVTGGQVTVAGSISGGTGNYGVGGFVGGNFAQIRHSGAEDVVSESGAVSGFTSETGTHVGNLNFPATMNSILVGGFAGYNSPKASISGSFSDAASETLPLNLDPTSPNSAAAAPAGSTFTLTATSGTLVTNSGTISGGAGFQLTGGFVGGNYGGVNQCYATGDVSVTGTTDKAASFYTGGFAGVNANNITNVYAQGSVANPTSVGAVGGLMGAQIPGGVVTNAYSVGAVSGGASVGGLTGTLAGGAVRGSFWDVDTSGQAISSTGSGTPEGAGEPDASLMVNPGDVSTSVFVHAGWNFKTIWLAPDLGGYPLLLGVGAGAEAEEE